MTASAELIYHMSIALGTPDSYSRAIPTEKGNREPRCRRLEEAGAIRADLSPSRCELRRKLVELGKAKDELMSASLLGTG